MLKTEKVVMARKEELEEFRKHKVYLKVPIEECYQVIGKGPLGITWIDIIKGDEEYEEYRSRLVGNENCRGTEEALYAATPPLEAMKIIFSLVVTEGVGYQAGCKTGGHKLGPQGKQGT